MIKSSHCRGERTESITESSSDLIHWLRETPHLFYQNAVEHDCLLLGVAVADFSTMAREREKCLRLFELGVMCVMTCKSNLKADKLSAYPKLLYSILTLIIEYIYPIYQRKDKD